MVIIAVILVGSATMIVLLANNLLFQHPALIDIEVHEEMGRLTFAFFRSERGWWATKQRPAGVRSLTIDAVGDGVDKPAKVEEIWKITSPGAQALASTITFGHVPPGFTQQSPANRAPAQLRPGRAYRVEVRGGTWSGRRFMTQRQIQPDN